MKITISKNIANNKLVLSYQIESNISGMSEKCLLLNRLYMVELILINKFPQIIIFKLTLELSRKKM